MGNGTRAVLNAAPPTLVLLDLRVDEAPQVETSFLHPERKVSKPAGTQGSRDSIRPLATRLVEPSSAEALGVVRNTQAPAWLGSLLRPVVENALRERCERRLASRIVIGGVVAGNEQQLVAPGDRLDPVCERSDPVDGREARLPRNELRELLPELIGRTCPSRSHASIFKRAHRRAQVISWAVVVAHLRIDGTCIPCRTGV